MDGSEQMNLSFQHQNLHHIPGDRRQVKRFYRHGKAQNQRHIGQGIHQASYDAGNGKNRVVAQASGGIGVDRLNHAAKPHDKNQEQVL